MNRKEVFKDKVAIVTGGGAGIGRALCRELVRRGSRVLVTGIRQKGVDETVSLIRSEGGDPASALLDVRDWRAVLRLVQDTAAASGGLDFMFNNAGVSVGGEIRDMTLEHWKAVIDVNLMGTLHGTLAAYGVMTGQASGHIVNISSLGGLLPFPIKAPYSTTKHALVGLSTSLRAEAADLGIRVSVVCPGLVQTGIWMKTPILKATNQGVRNIVKVKMYDVELAARRILSGVARNRAIITFPFHARLLWWLYRLNPALLNPLGDYMVREFRKIRR